MIIPSSTQRDAADQVLALEAFEGIVLSVVRGALVTSVLLGEGGLSQALVSAELQAALLRVAAVGKLPCFVPR